MNCILHIYCICLLYTSAGRMHGARYTYGENDSMNIIAAVVIGGTSFSGGKGTVFGTLLGSLVIGMLNNGLLLLGPVSYTHLIVRYLLVSFDPDPCASVLTSVLSPVLTSVPAL